MPPAVLFRLVPAAVLFVSVAAAAAQAPQAPPGPADDPKAREAFQAGKLDEALKALEAASKANPALPPPRVMLSRWSLEAGQGEQARLLLEQAAAQDPDHPEVLLTNASYALREGRLTDTILSCKAALAAADSPRWDADTRKRFQREARLGLVAAFEARGDVAGAKAVLSDLLAADPKNATLRQRLARTLFILDRPDDAFAELQRAFRDDPSVDPPELVLAQLWTARREFAKAEEWFAKAVAAHADSARVHRALTGYLLDRGKAEAAKAHLAAAQKLDPAARDTKALAGLLARHVRDFATARGVFEELVRDYPTDGFAAANLALVLAEAGHASARRRAAELAEAHVRQNPRLPEARAILGYCLLKLGRGDDAERVARSALGLGPLTPDGAYFLARILADRGAETDAQAILRLAVASTDGFVYRKEAQALLAELDQKHPPKKSP